MEKKKAQEVFSPGSLPESTYITRMTRSGFTYEERLQQALSVTGYLTLISGPSKIGKTVLCEKVIGLEHLVEMSGSDFLNEEDFWKLIGAKAGIPIGGKFQSERAGSSMSEEYLLTKETVIEHFRKNELVLLLDDFHYAKPEIQMYMAQQFKDAIRKGFKTVIATLPYRCDDAIRTNPDLQGRISLIDMGAWTADDLRAIPKKGFSELNVSISDELIQTLVEESISSPHLMQLICLNLCILEHVDEEERAEIKEQALQRAFAFSTLNLDYEKVAKVMQQGKNPRGKSRKQYETALFGKLDLYGLILEAIAIDPPFVSVEFEALMNRIQSIVTGEEKPTTKSLKDYLCNLQDVLSEKDRSYEVIEWKDDILYVLESLFLFYLRWGRD